MTRERTVDVLDRSGPAAPPRHNGELLFAAPWESQVLGLALALHGAGRFSWDEFRAALIEAIAACERARGEWSYYACWLTALERVVAAKGLCTTAEIADRARVLAARPPGHDHHDH